MDTVLALNGVTKNIRGKAIIKGINFTVKKGQIYGFLGPNGAGKTMTLRMIVGLIRPTAGDIQICGHSITKSFVKAMANVGCIIENPELYEYMTGYNNLLLLSRMEAGIDEERIREVVALVGMERRIHDKVSTYSLGMKQRLGIAQALMKQPQLLILDEPTNGLDPAGIKEFRQLVKSLAADHGMTILISSHLLSEIQMMCDEVAIILHGTIIKTAKVDTLALDQKVIWQANQMNQAPRILQLLHDQFGVEAIDHGDGTVSTFVDDETLLRINAAFVQAGIELLFVCKEPRNLEDLFLELTGGETIG
ncbi:MAG: ABC transporter ATP-binding protein [Bacillota bacterium]|nr:ABC transporter ATP-binding protein [Bacillota bacterium]